MSRLARLLLCLWLGLVLGAGPWTGLAVAQTDVLEALEQARLHYQDGEFQLSRDLLTGLMSQTLDRNTRVQAGLYLGFSEFRLGRRAEAQAAFEAVLSLDPDHRLDLMRTAPDLRAAFEDARAAAQGPRVSGVVSLLEPTVELSQPGKLPSMFSSRWYKKWWLWALVGASVAGIAVATTSGGGGGDGYVPPSVRLEVTTPRCGSAQFPNARIQGDIQTRVLVMDGRPPFTLQLTLDDVTIATRSASSTSLDFTFSAVPSGPNGACTTRTLGVVVIDQRNNDGRHVSDDEVMDVCRLCPP